MVPVAKTDKVYYALQLQLGVGDLVRDYVVLCHGLLPSSCQEINERVYFWPHEGNLPSIVCRKGKPSLTWVKVVAHSSRAAEDSSLVAPQEMFIHSMECVRSRTFSGPYEGSNWETRIKQYGLVAT